MLRPAINAETSLADVLERVLDKGMIIAGDISISLVDVELLTIKVRLLLASVDRATEMGIDWWRHDPFLTSQAAALTEERRALQDRLQRLEDLLHAGAATPAEDRATRLGPPND
jgi:hypothetical protein